MDQKEALEKVHEGTIVIYEGANCDINIGKVMHISEMGTVNVYDIEEGKGGEYTRAPEEYFIYNDIAEDDWYLINQKKYFNHEPTKEEYWWYKMCMQNIKWRDEYAEKLDKLRCNKRWFR